MKVLPSTADQFIKNILKQNIKGIFLYGEDNGVLMHREKELRKSFKDFEVIKIDLNGDGNVGDIFNESFTPSFFSTAKFIHIYSEGEAKLMGIERVLENIKEDFNNFILISVNTSLDSKSKIKKIFEEAENFATIGCYRDDAFTTTPILQNFLKENKLVMEGETVKYIIDLFLGNRALMLVELEKLKTYKGEGRVTLLEVKAIMEGDESGDIFKAINMFFSSQVLDFIKETKNLEYSNIHPSVLLTGIINYSFKLLELAEEVKTLKKNLDIILKEKFIFFKQIPIIKYHLTMWDVEKLNSLLQNLINLEIDVRKNQEKGYELLSVFIIKIGAL